MPARNAVFAAALVAGLAAAGPAPAQNSFRTGGWNGGVSFTGAVFSYCWVSRTYEDGRTLFIQLNGKLAMALGATKAGWDMDHTKDYNVVFEFDGGFKKTFAGKVAQERRAQIWFVMGNEPEIRQQLAKSASMTWVDSSGVKFPFALTNGADAMRKLLACAALYGVD